MRGTIGPSAPSHLRGLPAWFIRDAFLRAGGWFVLVGAPPLPRAVPASWVIEE